MRDWPEWYIRIVKNDEAKERAELIERINQYCDAHNVSDDVRKKRIDEVSAMGRMDVTDSLIKARKVMR